MKNEFIYILAKNYAIGIRLAIKSGLDIDESDIRLYNYCIYFIERYERGL